MTTTWAVRPTEEDSAIMSAVLEDEQRARPGANVTRAEVLRMFIRTSPKFVEKKANMPQPPAEGPEF